MERKEQVMQNLRDAGCPESETARFIELYDAGRRREALSVLELFRKRLLDSLHEKRRELGNLDYLIYSVEKELKR